MRTTLKNFSDIDVSHSGSERNPAFHVVLAYEDLASGLLAKETLDRLLHQVGQDFSFALKLWKFDLVSLPRFQEEVETDIAAADMIVLSAHRERALAMGAGNWLESALGMRSKSGGALVAFLAEADKTVQGASTRHAYLKGLARRSHLKFFSHAIEQSEHDAGDCEEPSAHPQSEPSHHL